MNQGEFARLGGVGLQTQSRYEQAATEPGVVYLASLAAHHVDVAWLLTGQHSLGELTAGESAWVAVWREMSEANRRAMLQIAHGLIGVRQDNGPSKGLHDARSDFDAGPEQ